MRSVPAAVVAALALLPIGYLLVRAASADHQAWSDLASAETVALLLRSLGLATAVAITGAIIAVPLGWLVTVTDLPGRRTLAALAAVPLVIPSYVGALVFISAFGPRGLLQEILEGPFGVTRLPEIYGFWGAYLTLTLFTYPYLLLMVIATLRRMDFALFDTARAMGYGPVSAFNRVVVPQLRGALAAGGLLAALYTLSDFGVVSLMRFDTFTRVIYVHYRSLYDRSGAALLALVLVLVTLFVVLGEIKARGRAERQGSTAVRPRTIELGRWRWPALMPIAGLLGLALAVPVGVLVYWIVRSLDETIDWPVIAHATLNSLTASGIAAAVAAVLAFPIALMAVRSTRKTAKALEALSSAGYALPGIVVALGLVFFSIRYASPLYQTLTLLVLAYVIRFIPQSIAATRTALARANPSIEDAARSLGHSRRSIFWRVTLPLAAPGVVSGALLVFLTAMKELPATLILRPTEFDTLATEVWSRATTAAYSKAAIPALILIAVSAVPLLFSGAREPSARQE